MTSPMHFTIEIPDAIARPLAPNPEELGRRILEGFAAESYRHGRWTATTCRWLSVSARPTPLLSWWPTGSTTPRAAVSVTMPVAWSRQRDSQPPHPTERDRRLPKPLTFRHSPRRHSIPV